MNDTDIPTALFTVHDRLAGTAIEWAVTASANLWLQGLDITPGDIDILSDKGGVYRIESLFEAQVIRPVQPPEIAAKERIRSHFGALSLNGVEVELMGDVEHRIDGEWVPTDDVAEHREFTERGGRAIPVMPLEHELAGYRDLGRTDRIALLEDHLGEGGKR